MPVAAGSPGRPINSFSSSSAGDKPSISENSYQFAHPDGSNVRPRVQRNTGMCNRCANFFISTRERYRVWKTARNTTSLKKSVIQATISIEVGLKNYDEKLIYQGFKQLHAAKNKRAELGIREGIDFYHQEVMNQIAKMIEAGDADMCLSAMAFIPENIHNLVDRYSGRNTLFHRMLEGLGRANLLPADYIRSRNAEVQANHDQVKNSLLELQDLFIEPLRKGLFAVGDIFLHGIGVERDLVAACSFHTSAGVYGSSAGTRSALALVMAMHLTPSPNGPNLSDLPDAVLRHLDIQATELKNKEFSNIRVNGDRYHDARPSLQRSAISTILKRFNQEWIETLSEQRLLIPQLAERLHF